MTKIKFIFIILFICLIFLITGCSSYKEINNVLIVDGIGIDKVNDKYIVSFNSFVENDEYKVIDIEVDNIDEAFRDVYLLSNKKIYLSHLDILLLSSKLSNEDIINIVNTFNNRNDIRGTFLVSLVHKYKSNIFSNKSLYLTNLIKNNYYESGDIYPSTFNDIINNYLDFNISYIPVISNDLHIMGTHSIFDEFRYYNIDESKYLNLILNRNKVLVLDIKNEEVKFKDINILYNATGNNLSINIYMTYVSNLDEREIVSYLENKYIYLLNLDINNNYFKTLIMKYDYDYYKMNQSFDISYDIKICLNKEDISNTKGGNYFEKDI